jgi:hypothetical protein
MAFGEPIVHLAADQVALAFSNANMPWTGLITAGLALERRQGGAVLPLTLRRTWGADESRVYGFHFD